MLILGKRYGSVNEKTGISYTEMEYNYAIDKGIPVLVFAIDDSVELENEKVELYSKMLYKSYEIEYARDIIKEEVI